MIDRTMTLDGDVLSGVVVVADEPVGHLTYPRHVLERMLPGLADGRHFVHATLPSEPDDFQDRLITVGAVITEAVIRDDGAFFVRANVIATPSGTMLRTLASKKCYGLSLVAMGSARGGIVGNDAIFKSLRVVKLREPPEEAVQP